MSEPARRGRIRALYHLGSKPNDPSRLTQAFPGVEFVLTREPAAAARELAQAEILIINSTEYTREIAAAAARARGLRWIQFTSSGLDAAQGAGPLPSHVQATNVAGLRAGNLAEHAFALLLFMTRRLRRAEELRAEARWSRDSVFGELVSLSGRRMLVIGMGAVGQSIARRARAFEMTVAAVSRAYRQDDLVERVFARGEALEAFRQADVVMIAAPSEQETRGYVDAEKLAAMKRTAFLVNVSRGDLVDEAALVEACRARRIAGAALDVTVIEPLPPESELWRLENVVVTPHAAGGGSEQYPRLLDCIAENLDLYLRGEPLKRRVSF